MGLEGGYRHSTSRHPGRPAGGNGEAGPEPGRGEAHSASQRDEGSGREDLLAQVLSRENMVLAWKRVEANKGSAGVDGLTIEQTAEVLKTQWPKIREELESGQYRPQAVRRVEIPKPGGGIRELGIPTVVDRLIQQGLLQVLHPVEEFLEIDVDHNLVAFLHITLRLLDRIMGTPARPKSIAELRERRVDQRLKNL